VPGCAGSALSLSFFLVPPKEASFLSIHESSEREREWEQEVRAPAPAPLESWRVQSNESAQDQTSEWPQDKDNPKNNECAHAIFVFLSFLFSFFVFLFFFFCLSNLKWLCSLNGECHLLPSSHTIKSTALELCHVYGPSQSALAQNSWPAAGSAPSLTLSFSLRPCITVQRKIEENHH